ncbi:MAG: hypothetical protein VB862_06505, partial [Pirellulaceae bacterium]
DDVLQAQFEKSQALDQQLTEVFADVPVPAGLRERLQEAIAQAVAYQGLPIDECRDTTGPAEDQQSDPVIVEVTEERRFSQSLRWLALAASLLIVAAVWRQFQPAEPVSPELLAGQATTWTERVMAASHDWNSDLRQSPSTHPIDSYVLPKPQRWSRLKTNIDPRAVVYDLSSLKTDRLLLFVFRSRQSYQVPRVALQELMGTGALTVGAWQQGDLLYVMVGRRNGPALQQFIKQRLLGYLWRVPAAA